MGSTRVTRARRVCVARWTPRVPGDPRVKRAGGRAGRRAGYGTAHTPCRAAVGPGRGHPGLPVGAHRSLSGQSRVALPGLRPEKGWRPAPGRARLGCGGCTRHLAPDPGMSPPTAAPGSPQGSGPTCPPCPVPWTHGREAREQPPGPACGRGCGSRGHRRPRTTRALPPRLRPCPLTRPPTARPPPPRPPGCHTPRRHTSPSRTTPGLRSHCPARDTCVTRRGRSGHPEPPATLTLSRETCSFCSWSRYFSMLKKVSKNTLASLHLFRSRRVIFPTGRTATWSCGGGMWAPVLRSLENRPTTVLGGHLSRQHCATGGRGRADTWVGRGTLAPGAREQTLRPQGSPRTHHGAPRGTAQGQRRDRQRPRPGSLQQPSASRRPAGAASCPAALGAPSSDPCWLRPGRRLLS